VQVQLGHSADLEELLGCPGPFWSRKYFFWNKGRPLTLIHEVFSPQLEVLLGPAS
jgi:chorismate lyase